MYTTGQNSEMFTWVGYTYHLYTKNILLKYLETLNQNMLLYPSYANDILYWTLEDYILVSYLFLVLLIHFFRRKLEAVGWKKMFSAANIKYMNLCLHQKMNWTCMICLYEWKVAFMYTYSWVYFAAQTM